MNSGTIERDIKNLSKHGVTLGLEEKIHVELACIQLQLEMACEEVYFWGKIEGK